MSTDRSYKSTVLCAFINSGRVRLPLSHSGALEAIAVLEGVRDWNSLAQRAEAKLFKTRAKILRAEINRRSPDMQLSEVDANAAIEQLRKAEDFLPPEPLRPGPERAPVVSRLD